MIRVLDSTSCNSWEATLWDTTGTDFELTLAEQEKVIADALKGFFPCDRTYEWRPPIVNFFDEVNATETVTEREGVLNFLKNKPYSPWKIWKVGQRSLFPTFVVHSGVSVYWLRYPSAASTTFEAGYAGNENLLTSIPFLSCSKVASSASFSGGQFLDNAAKYLRVNGSGGSATNYNGSANAYPTGETITVSELKEDKSWEIDYETVG